MDYEGCLWAFVRLGLGWERKVDLCNGLLERILHSTKFKKIFCNDNLPCLISSLLFFSSHQLHNSWVDGLPHTFTVAICA